VKSQVCVWAVTRNNSMSKTTTRVVKATHAARKQSQPNFMHHPYTMRALNITNHSTQFIPHVSALDQVQQVNEVTSRPCCQNAITLNPKKDENRFFN